MNYPEWPLISVDTHGGGPPEQVYAERVPRRFREEIAAYTTRKIEGEGENKRESDPTSTWKRRRALTPELLDKIENTADTPESRLELLGLDGVGGAVILAGGGVPYLPGVSVEAAVAQCQVFNDWMAETYRKYYDRFAPAAASPLAYDIDAGVKELRRAAKLGLRPVLIPRVQDRLVNRPEYDPFWAEVNDLGIPLMGPGGITDNKPYRNPGGAVPNIVYCKYTQMEPVSLLVCSGVLERFPNVVVAAHESDIGWLVWCMEAMDRYYLKHAYWVSPQLPLMPSEYVQRQLKFGFEEDPIGIQNRHITGLEPLMWGNDFPHHEGTWPQSRDVIAETFGDCTMAEMKQITHDNAAKLYGLKVDTFVEAEK
jgi:predicted TIM-barrel fold metal-dependent hydrolase